MTITSRTKVLPGHQVLITDESLPEGAEVEVTVEVKSKQLSVKEALELIESLPPQRNFKTAEEVVAYIRAERDSWE